jgi:hypothetical protein
MNWKTIFELSKVNGALYIGDRLPAQNWRWPKGTWLQERLKKIRKGEVEDEERNYQRA